ncbi:MAG: oligoendopeptidase F [Firmicutes bacterium]|nr:oligoendopeptidase F [Bacillota bacterium]
MDNDGTTAANTRYHWDLQALFANDDACLAEIQALTLELEADPFAHARGSLAMGANVVRNCLELSQTLLIRQRKISVYASCRCDEDLRDGSRQALRSAALNARQRLMTCLSFISEQMSELPPETVAEYLKDPLLADFRATIRRMVRDKPHRLSSGEERIVNALQSSLHSPERVWTVLTDADFCHGTIVVDAVEHEVTNARYTALMRVPDRRVRRAALARIHSTFHQHRNSLAALYDAQVRTSVALAQLRGHASARDAALFRDDIPASVYDALIEGVHRQLGHLHRYMELRRSWLGLPAVMSFDRHVALVEAGFHPIGYEEAFSLFADAFAPLGPDYVSLLERAITERWVDVYPAPGKYSLAYSAGGYGTLPYIMFNYQGDLGNVMTLAHELGHSCHTALSCAVQPPQTASYSMFIAEIASTVHELLLVRHLLETTADNALRALLLDQYLQTVTNTLYNQTMHAEFEWRMHERVERGGALPADDLGAAYGELTHAYAGPAFCDEQFAAEGWARIRHFYMDFYLYNYATGISAAMAIVDRILAGDTAARDRYLKLLRSGSSRPPLELLQTAGLDLSQPHVVADALDTYGRLVDELADLQPQL